MKNGSLWTLLVLGAIIAGPVGTCHGFVVSNRQHAHLQGDPLTSYLQSRRSDNNDNGDDEAFYLSRERNDARTDVRNLLTQRAIQSFMFLW